MISLHRLPSVGSTSTYLREELVDAPHGTVVVTDCQTAGRGQRGNCWEAEPGMNLTFSVLMRPEGVDAAGQYAISEAVATAIVNTLRPLVDDPGALAVKWPNDIYYRDLKICGILIENTLTGMKIGRSIAGVGINVNQRQFVSDAPNPVSLWQITGREHDLEHLLTAVSEAILSNVERLADSVGRQAIGREYRSMLWRREGVHPYAYPDGRRFMAEIAGVAPTGHLTLRHTDGSLTTHAFKEVVACLS